MKKIIKIFLFLNLLFFSFSQKLVDISDYVNDYAGMISYDIEQKIREKFIQLEESDSTQIVFVTINSLDGYPIEEYSIKLAEKFKIGQKKKDNGVIFLVSKEDRKMRIEVGFGLEGVLTDLLSARIINNIVAPKFKEGDYDGGFIACADELINVVKGEYKNDETSSLPKSKNDDGILFVAVVFAYLIARFFSLFIKNNPLIISGIGGIGGMVFPLFLGAANFFIMLLAGILAFFISFIPFSTLLMIFLLSGGIGGGRGGSRSGSGGFSAGSSRRTFSGGGGGFGGGGASGGW